MRDDRRNASREEGFALILAILSLMLLTFLGLTLATTTSTELQIATNYRWSQQALYNAQAGLEASKLLLSNVAKAGGNWGLLVPGPRTVPWVPPINNQNPGAPAATPSAITGRDYERSNCTPGDRSGIGYGVVLRAPDPLSATPTRWENISSFMGQGLNGAFTVWIRREVAPATDGTFTDDAAGAPTALVVTSEGVAPFIGASTAFTRANQASRVIELTLALVTVDKKCRQPVGQEGAGPSGENFDTCSKLTAGAGGSLGRVFGGGAGSGTLTSLPVVP
jgi:PilX N-terminal